MTAAEQRERAYLATGGNNCLHCGSENVSGAHFSADSGTASQVISCADCRKEWTDVYNLVGVSEH